ncbi:hypothetical protein TI03_02210 [Achromatium sp. WMS1]|nr:hypothetical protein TI03_02210 [Achromatium sp. WMS1]
MPIGQTDAPISSRNEESLGIIDHAEALSDFILNCQTPMTISIQGDWGTGKTSMMYLVQTILKEKGEITESFLFNTWQFSQFKMQEDIAISMLSSFLDDLGDCAKDAKKIMTKLGWIVAKTAASAVGIPNSVSEDVASALNNELDPAQQVKKLKEHIEKAVENRIAAKNASRLVVFIDDLDRLLPERAVDVLEAIKIFLDIPKCVFVLAVDYPIIAKGLEKKFGIGIDDIKGRNFFDKIIQMPFNLPVSLYKTKNYMRELLSWLTVVQLDEEDLQRLVLLADHSVGSNPRTLKRLMNTLHFLHGVAKRKLMLKGDEEATEKQRFKLLFATLCLQVGYEPVYRLLLKQTENDFKESLQTLADQERIKSDERLFSELERIGVKKEEQLTRLVQFMEIVAKTIQLKESTENDDNIPDGLFLLRDFILLVDGRPPTVFPYKNKLHRFFKETIEPKFQSRLENMGTNLAISFYDLNADIGFKIDIAQLPLSLFVKWTIDGVQNHNFNVLLRGGSRNTDKLTTAQWMETQLKNVFPKQQRAPHMGAREYYYLHKESFSKNEVRRMEMSGGMNILDTYKQLVEDSLKKFIPELEVLYQRTQPLLTSLNDYCGSLLTKLEHTFPTTEGFEVHFDNRENPWIRYSAFRISHPDWNNQFKLVADPQDFWLSKMGIGIRKTRREQGYGDHEQEVFESCKREVAHDITNTCENDGWWIFYVYYGPPVNSSTLTKPLTDPDCCFIDNSQALIDQIVDCLTRFKHLLPQLKQLAAPAE